MSADERDKLGACAMSENDIKEQDALFNKELESIRKFM